MDTIAGFLQSDFNDRFERRAHAPDVRLLFCGFLIVLALQPGVLEMFTQNIETLGFFVGLLFGLLRGAQQGINVDRGFNVELGFDLAAVHR